MSQLADGHAAPAIGRTIPQAPPGGIASPIYRRSCAKYRTVDTKPLCSLRLLPRRPQIPCAFSLHGSPVFSSAGPPCRSVDLLPMSPVYSVTHVPGLDPPFPLPQGGEGFLFG